MRIKFLRLFFILLFLSIFFGLFNLGVIQARKFKDLSDRNCIRLLPQIGSRGNILDRWGNIIAGNILSYDLMILPDRRDKLEVTLSRLSEILAVNSQDLKERFNRGRFSFSMPVTVVENIDLKKAMALEELKLDLAGVIIKPRPLRYYPGKRLAAHVLGYLSEIDRWRLTRLADYGYKTKDIMGFGGVEEKYDYYLRQEDGGLSVQIDSQGRFVRALGFKPPHNGKDLQLTLDLKIQQIVENVVAQRKGCVIIMEPESGEIIALVSSPDFDPEIFTKKLNYSIRNLYSNPDAPMVNRAVSGVYPAGSIFKLIVATAAIETGKINSATTFFCTGGLNLGRQKFNCWDTHGEQNLMGAITRSCNVFFYRTGLLLGGQLLHDYALRFGFSKPTAVDLPYESSGFVPSPLWKKIYKFKHWFDGDTVNLSIGQGEI